MPAIELGSAFKTGGLSEVVEAEKGRAAMINSPLLGFG